MTEGNVTSQLFRFSVPIVLGNIFQQLYNTADAMIVGKMIGNNAFAAVSVANPIMSVVLFFLVGLSMGVGILLAQWYGAQDIKMFKVQYSTALIAGCVFTVAASLLCIVCSRWMLLAANTPAEIMEDTNWYLRIIFAGLFFSFLYNYLAAALRAIGDSRSAFLFLVISSVTNVILDIVFIRYTPLGVAGAAVATVISQALSSILCVIYIYKKIPILALARSEFVYEKSVMKNTLLFSWTSALQQTFLYFGRLLVQGTINAQGTDMITGYNAAIRLEAFMMAFIDGTQSAMSTFGGQNVGAHHPERLKKGLLRTLQMDLAYIVLFSALMLSMPRTLVGLYVDLDNAAAVEIGVTYITVMPLFYLCCGVVSALQGFFRGIGKIRIAMTATFSQIAMRCILSVILVPRYGIYGVCASVGTGWVLMVVYSSYNCIHYFRKKQLTIEEQS